MNDEHIAKKSPGEIEDELYEVRQNVTTREEFLSLLRLLLDDYDANRGDWENLSIRDYLEGMRGVCMGLEGFYSNQGVDVDCNQPSWQILADLLLAARVHG